MKRFFIVLSFMLIAMSSMYAADDLESYPQRLASSEEIRACFEEVKKERGSLIIGGSLWQRLCVQASKDPSFEIKSVSEPILAMAFDSKDGMIVDHEGALVILNLLNYVPWNGGIERGKYTTYYQVQLNGLQENFFMDGYRDSERSPVYILTFTDFGIKTFENDEVRRAEVKATYKALYERAKSEH